MFLECHVCGLLFTARRRSQRPTCQALDCRRALKRQQMREYAAKVAAREGVPYSTYLARIGKKVGSYRLTSAQRAAIYERDDWTCQLCAQPVDRTLDPNDDMAASLDHIVPRAHGGSHDESNLRLAHRWCNTIRWFYPDLDLTKSERRTASALIPHGR